MFKIKCSRLETNCESPYLEWNSPPNETTLLKRLQFLYARYGGVPRLLFDTIFLSSEAQEWAAAVNMYDNEVRMVLRDMAAESRPLSSLEDITITQEVSFKAFFYVSTDVEEACAHNYAVRIATPYISGLLSLKVFATRKAQQRAFYHRLMEVPSLRTAAGTIFERLVHQYFAKRKRNLCLGKSLDGTSQVGQVPDGTIFPVFKSEEFSSLSDLGATLHRKNSSQVKNDRENIYFRPLASNQTSIDSFLPAKYKSKDGKPVPIVIMFQITIASSHEIKTLGIDALRAILPCQARSGHPHLVFVVPTGNRMRGTQVYTPSSGPPPWAGYVVQSVLELSEDQLFKD